MAFNTVYVIYISFCMKVLEMEESCTHHKKKRKGNSDFNNMFLPVRGGMVTKLQLTGEG